MGPRVEVDTTVAFGAEPCELVAEELPVAPPPSPPAKPTMPTLFDLAGDDAA
jgi:hypothetical protein